jgi:hypothetical protein
MLFQERMYGIDIAYTTILIYSPEIRTIYYKIRDFHWYDKPEVHRSKLSSAFDCSKGSGRNAV